MDLEGRTHVNHGRRGEEGFKVESKETGHLPPAELSCSHYKYQYDTLIALRDFKDLEVEEKEI